MLILFSSASRRQTCQTIIKGWRKERDREAEYSQGSCRRRGVRQEKTEIVMFMCNFKSWPGGSYRL